MKILLAIDDSKFSDAALKTIIAQTRPEDTEVRVVKVVEPMEAIFPDGEWESGMTRDLEELRKGKLKRAQDRVSAAAETMRGKGFGNVDTAVRVGDARVEIINAATQWPADLVVVGSHGRKGLDRFLLGSVSEFVTRHAPCSVQIVRLAADR